MGSHPEPRAPVEIPRIRMAVLLPLVVFPVAAAVAIAFGWLLHQVPEDVPFGSLHVPIPTLVALVFVLAITAAGFIASARGGPNGDGS